MKFMRLYNYPAVRQESSVKTKKDFVLSCPIRGKRPNQRFLLLPSFFPYWEILMPLKNFVVISTPTSLLSFFEIICCVPKLNAVDKNLNPY